MIELQKKNAHITFTTPSVIGGEGGNVDLSNYYTKSEVDTKIDKIELTPGPAGKDGYTPVKGIDYFDGKDYVLTQADKQDIANMIDVPTGGGGDGSGGCSPWLGEYEGELYNAKEIVFVFYNYNYTHTEYFKIVNTDGQPCCLGEASGLYFTVHYQDDYSQMAHFYFNGYYLVSDDYNSSMLFDEYIAYRIFHRA